MKTLKLSIQRSRASYNKDERTFYIPMLSMRDENGDEVSPAVVQALIIPKNLVLVNNETKTSELFRYDARFVLNGRPMLKYSSSKDIQAIIELKPGILVNRHIFWIVEEVTESSGVPMIKRMFGRSVYASEMPNKWVSEIFDLIVSKAPEGSAYKLYKHEVWPSSYIAPIEDGVFNWLQTCQPEYNEVRERCWAHYMDELMISYEE